MLKPRDEILLDVVGEVLRNGLAEVRRETDARFAALTPVDLGPLEAKVAEQETLHIKAVEYVNQQIDLLSTDVTKRLEALPPINDKIDEVEKTLLESHARTLDSIAAAKRDVDERIAALPPPQKGDPGPKGSPGEPGVPGKDGTSVTIDQVRELLDASFAKWALDVERRIMDMAQKAIDRMPQPVNGVDGIGVEDMEFVSLDERTFEMRWLRDGKVVKTHTHRFATPLDEGVWKAGGEYQKGAGVTWGGSWFIAQVDQPKGRPEQSPDWRLAVKHGRDGKNGNDGKRGEKGDPGPRGQNLTALMPNGERFP